MSGQVVWLMQVVKAEGVDPLDIPEPPRTTPIPREPGMFTGTFWLWAMIAIAAELAIGLAARVVLG